MGCASSGMFRKRPQDVMVSPHILDTYIHLEKEIVREERTAPAPALSHSLGRVDDLAIDLEAAQQRLSRFARTPSGANDESLREVLIDLGVDKSPDVAAEHEEFIANINRQALAQNEVDILSRRLEEAEEEVKMLTSKVNFLQGLYQQQDTLLDNQRKMNSEEQSRFETWKNLQGPQRDTTEETSLASNPDIDSSCELFGEAYGSQEEKKLEDELDRLRSYRDTLAGGTLDWREASTYLQGAVELLDRAVQVCKQLASQNAESRFHLATEARNCLQEAALSVQMAQALLPGVQFPYCSAREITTVLQAVVYMFTDIHIPDRLSHANRCYMTFWERTKALQKWINQTIETSLSKDLADVNQKMGEVNIKLRRIRVGLVRNQMDEEDVEAYEAAARKQSHASLFIDSVEGEGSSILPPGGHHLDHDRLFRSSQNIVAPRTLRNNKDKSGDKLQMQLKKRLGSNRSQVWSRQNLDEMHLSYMRSQQ